VGAVLMPNFNEVYKN